MEIYKLADEASDDRSGSLTKHKKYGRIDVEALEDARSFGGARKITDIRQGVKNPNRVNVFVNGKYAFSLDAALQMDMKVHGLPVEILEKAIKQSHAGRMFILDHIVSVIDKPRAEISKYAPQIEKLMINPDKIGAVIGKGGEMINKITSETGAEVDIEDNGLVTISGTDPEKIQKALDWVRGLTEEPEVGKIYNGTVAAIKDFGAFVTILPGIDGMLHISQISDKRLKKVEEVLHMGDKVRVRLVAIDDKGRLSLTMKGLD